MSQPRHRLRGEIKSQYDAIVVGAGIGGIVTANLLARRKKRVLLLEQHSAPGGCTTSFKRKGFTFDIGLHYIGDGRPDGDLRHILHLCGVDDVALRPLDHEMERVYLPGLEFRIPANRDEFCRRLIARFPSEANGIRRYFRFLEGAESVNKAEVSGSKLRFGWSLVSNPLVVRYALGTQAPLVDSCTQNPQLQALLNLHCGIHACSPTRVSAALHAGVQNHFLELGGFYPEGGGQRLTERLIEEFERAGGELRLMTKVDRIDIESGRAVGVHAVNKFTGQHEVRADAIVANADLKRTVLELVGAQHFRNDLGKRAAKFEMAYPLFAVFLGLRVPPEALGVGNSNVWICSRLDFAADYRLIERGEMPLPPSVFVSIKSLKDPTDKCAAPPGHTNMEVMAVVPRDLAFWKVTPEEVATRRYTKNPAYREVKAQLTEACIAQAARVLPCLADNNNIVICEAASPLTQMRYLSTSDGASYGLAATPEQFLGNRPTVESGLPGLYFCGTSCRTGLGVVSSMGSGHQAANAVCAH